MFEQVWRFEPNRRLAKVFGLTQHGRAEFPGPWKDVLEYVFVNRLQTGGVKCDANGMLEEFVAALGGLGRLKGG
jgi:hypothetical protein